ncbi:hypothetical protein NXV12_26115 [Bacteroides thetaiotaomicron]|nr:hypothetical protein [Bacteroides thetaiotaomicron]
MKRAMPEDELMKMASEAGLKGTSYPTVVDAVRAAKKTAPLKTSSSWEAAVLLSPIC